MKIRTALLLFFFICPPVFAQSTTADRQQKEAKSEQAKSDNKTKKTGEIKLDDLHLQAQIEKPSVSILPKRVEPDLEKVEFITRSFDRELKMVPEGLFDLAVEKEKVEKIRDIEAILKKDRN